ncbi:alpha/beta fold hydrolase [Rubrivivax benzoatilyticus]|uniref:Alpha/beta hydrolase n=1 Tax=Rubrivivax benzoatilyticus TaxID=316997 RepID=A0ABX0HQV3_9BURK|nr:alpha/beta hydrolase [Rubrivivax benzoatilyticus]EGJ09765.1 alpha/beta hydrolase fold protein [Rubrivivax benzoatilyticus JA2 = ATCC BAA-35]NHK97442.1 alpha/beta hydrolase [Rubrivivax benzoatilyticus]NHL22863.1 alpha/beta hydrolase [Rubrivivax benzoatilyticus]
MRLVLRLLGLLLMLTAVLLAMSRAPDRSVESLVANWAPPPSDFVDLGGQLVHLRDEGPRSQVPLVLLHGTSSSLHTWEGWVRSIAPGRRVITLDLPGFGLTGPWAGRYAGQRYDGETLARFVLELLDRLGVQRFAVGGNSLGGEVAWRLAAMAPQRVERLILVDASGTVFSSGGMPLAWQFARVPGLGRAFEWVLPRTAVSQGVASAYGDPSRVTAELVDRYFELTLREGNRRALVERLRSARSGEDADRISTLRLPTLILWGGRDTIIPPSAGEDFARRIPGSRLVVFPALGHVPHEEDPAQTVAPVLEFLGLG